VANLLCFKLECVTFGSVNNDMKVMCRENTKDFCNKMEWIIGQIWSKITALRID